MHDWHASRRTFLRSLPSVLAAALSASVAGSSCPASAAAKRKQTSPEPSRRRREYIERAKQAILHELKPTNAQIERGLELHHNTVVCDLYGGVPTNVSWALSSESMRKWAIHRLSEAKDADQKRKMVPSIVRELVQWMALEAVHDPVMEAEHSAFWAAARIDVGLDDVAWAPEGGDERFSLEQISRATYIYDHYEHLQKLLHSDDLPQHKREGKHLVLWHIGRPDACFAGPHVKDSIKNLDLFYGWGVRHCQLTNSTRNQVGCSHYQDRDTGLTDVGRAVIHRMNGLGMFVDLSHSGHRTTLDAIHASNEPVVISHTACRSVAVGGKSKYRNATDEAIKAVAEKGGMIGICSMPNLLGGYGVEPFLRHIDHAVKLVGADHVGIGSDLGGMGVANQPPELLEASKPGKFLPQGLKGTEGHWKWDTEPNALSWTNAPYLTVALVCQGYSDEEVRKIIGGSFLRVVSAVLDKRPRGVLI